MARFIETTVGQLARGWLLAPERYDRPAFASGGIPLPTLAQLSSEIVTPKAIPVAMRTRVLDTGDALAGFARATPSTARPDFRSNKKRLRPGDVIVSRLRPYLRQVAYLDASLFEEDGQAVDVVAAVSPRTSLVLKADIRPGYTGQLTAKVERIERALGG